MLRCLVLVQAPGELGTFGQAWNPYPDNPVAFSKLQLKELKNGRLAMLAIMGELSAYVLNEVVWYSHAWSDFAFFMVGRPVLKTTRGLRRSGCCM